MSLLLLAALVAGPTTEPSRPAEPAAPAPVAAQARPRNIPVGDPMRLILLDALRPSIEGDLGQPVKFVVDQLKVQGDWAFYAGHPQRPNGGAIDFRNTHYRQAMAEGMFDGAQTYALLRRVDGRWTVATFVVGPTDVAYLGWSDEYGTPMSLFE